MKCLCLSSLMRGYASPPVWGAWIEIAASFAFMILSRVALRMGGVD